MLGNRPLPFYRFRLCGLSFLIGFCLLRFESLLKCTRQLGINNAAVRPRTFIDLGLHRDRREQTRTSQNQAELDEFPSVVSQAALLLFKGEIVILQSLALGWGGKEQPILDALVIAIS